MLVELNADQLAAAQHGDGPLLIVAGAGTGKTATLVHRVAELIERGADPRRILLLTFTRRAAAEMLRRVEAVLAARGHDAARRGTARGAPSASGAAPSTPAPPACCASTPATSAWSRTSPSSTGATRRTSCTSPARASASAAAARRFPQKSTCLDVYSRCVNAQLPLNEVLHTAFPWCLPAEEGLAQLFAAYTDAKEEQQVLDYDDLLLFWRGLLADPAGGARVRERFDHVLVDEYQDTNALQADIVSLLRPDGDGVTCVGDDAQAIYAFRAATVRNILDFEQRFPGAQVVTLTQNYRSTAPILAATNALIAEAAERRDKELWTDRAGGGRPVLVTCRDEDEQTQWVCERILAHREQGTELKQQAVLFRAQHHSMALEMELSRRNIPFHKYGGLRFVEMAHVKDLVSFLRLAENPRDAMAGLRVLGLVPGIGPKTAAALLECAGRRRRRLPAAWAGARVPEPARAAWPAVVELFATLAAAGPSDVPAQVHAVRSVYGPLLERRYDNVQARLRDLEQIEGLAARSQTRSQFLAELVLDPPAYTQELAGPPLLDEDYLILSHDALGQGPRVRRRLRHPRRRRQHPLGHGDGQRRRDRGGAAPALRRLHARPRPALREPPAALLHAAVGQGRHPRLRAALALPHAGRGGALRGGPDRARADGGRRGPARPRHHRLHPRRRAGSVAVTHPAPLATARRRPTVNVSHRLGRPRCRWDDFPRGPGRGGGRKREW